MIEGIDHVLFLVGLFCQAWMHARGNLRTAASMLARTATSFTIAHSLTLSATVLGVLRVPPAVSEACIAWSLVLVALDIGDGRRPRAALAGAFGLVHGLGFAGALAETRLPEGTRGVALALFNVGVEMGQVLLFAACAGVVCAVPRFVRGATRDATRGRLADASAYVVGISGATMFFLRVQTLLRG